MEQRIEKTACAEFISVFRLRQPVENYQNVLNQPHPTYQNLTISPKVKIKKKKKNSYFSLN
jgi:hypothetical protein